MHNLTKRDVPVARPSIRVVALAPLPNGLFGAVFLDSPLDDFPSRWRVHLGLRQGRKQIPHRPLSTGGWTPWTVSWGNAGMARSTGPACSWRSTERR